jgi:hypothetical protein
LVFGQLRRTCWWVIGRPGGGNPPLTRIRGKLDLHSIDSFALYHIKTDSNVGMPVLLVPILGFERLMQKLYSILYKSLQQTVYVLMCLSA